MPRRRIPVLRVRDNQDHQERHHGGIRVDDQLPTIGETPATDQGAQKISTATDPTNTHARPVTAEETVLVERVRLEKGTVSEDRRASAEARKKNIQTDGIDRDRR